MEDVGHSLTPWKSAEEPVKGKRSFRRLSFFRAPMSTNSLPSPVLTTHTINKEYDPETGNKIINNFMIIKEIGRGVHGKVKLAQDLETGELVAIKIVDKQSRKRQLGYSLLKAASNINLESEQKIRREIAILKKCVHPHVVRLTEVIDDPASRKIYLALEYMEGGEIIWREDDESNTPVLSMNEARSIFRDVVSGLDYLHYQGIIHRDIKPANLLLTKDNIVKISDFGVSYFNQHLAGSKGHYDDEIDRELAETAGTPAFFAPELCSSIENQQHDHITKAIDVWALGVTLYCLIYGQCPFTASTEFELFDIIPTAPLTFPSKEEIGFDTPDNLKDLLQKLLVKDPQHRITLEEAKHHPWVIEDLENPELWWHEADPTQYKTVEVTDEEVSKAVTTIMDRLRKSIHRLSSSISNLTHSFTHRHHHHRSKSTNTNTTASSSHPYTPNSSDMHPPSSSSTASPISSQFHVEEEDYFHPPQPQPQPQQQQSQQQQQQQGWIPTSFTNMTLSGSSMSSTEESLSPPRRLPQSKDGQYPFPVDRNDSSSSSGSGLVVTFSRQSQHQ